MSNSFFGLFAAAEMAVLKPDWSVWDYGYELCIVMTTFVFIYKYYKSRKKVI